MAVRVAHVGPGRLVAIVCAAEILGMTPFSMFLAVQPELRDAWHLSNTAAGWIASAYYAGYMAAVPLLASLTDRVDARTVWLAATALGAAAAAGFGLTAEGVPTALLFQFMAGVSLAGTYMPGLKLIADRMEATPHPRYVAFYTTSFTIGTGFSFFAIGQLVDAMQWRAGIVAAAAGPALAWSIAFFFLSPLAPLRRTSRPVAASWRDILHSGEARRYVLAYACHMWELFGLRAWLVPFLVFCETMRGGPAFAEPATLAAFIALAGVPSSIAGAELSARRGARRLIVTVMLLSAAASVAFGLASALPWGVILAVSVVYSMLVSADSAALTAGIVAVSPRDARGTAMAVYSTAGFAAASVAPVAIGIVLDLFGGESVAGWTLAFALLGASNVIGALVLARTTTPQSLVGHPVGRRNSPTVTGP